MGVMGYRFFIRKCIDNVELCLFVLSTSIVAQTDAGVCVLNTLQLRFDDELLLVAIKYFPPPAAVTNVRFEYTICNMSHQSMPRAR